MSPSPSPVRVGDAGAGRRGHLRRLVTPVAAGRRPREAPGVVGVVNRAYETRAALPRLTRLFVRDRGRIVPVRVADIHHLEARDDYVAVYVEGGRLLAHMALNDLALRLDPERFLRVHRSHIVNLDYVRALVPYDGTRLQVELRDGTRIMASRTRSREVRRTAV